MSTPSVDPTSAGSAQGSDSHALKRSLTWTRVAALGVAISVSGSFAGWNYGLGPGGAGGMIVAAFATGLMFYCLTQAVAELAAAMPSSAGFDAYIGAVLGPVAGFIAGICVALGLAVGTGLALSFTAAYTQGMFGIGGWPVEGVLLAIVLALHLRGAKEAVGFTMLIGGFAVLVLLTFCISMAPHFAAQNLYADVNGIATLFPGGVLGTVQAVPFALFMFLGVEQAAQAAAEVHDPARSMPRALFVAILVAFLIGIAVLLIATGATGSGALATADDPLLAAVHAQPQDLFHGMLGRVVGTGALISFLATFFSLAYGSSRQFHHLASSGSLPHWLTRTNARGAPVPALAIMAAIGAVTAAFPPESAMIVFIFLLVIMYELLLIAFLRFHQTASAAIVRPYRAVGGAAVGWIGAILGLAAVLCCYQLEMAALSYALVVLAALIAYFLWRRSGRGRAVAP
jgi:ethanolamine permease